jgi:phosphoketolase
MIIKQLKGTGVHKVGAKAHNLYPADTLDAEHIVAGLQRRALSPEAWRWCATTSAAPAAARPPRPP